jgi:copper chaperone CopZ
LVDSDFKGEKVMRMRFTKFISTGVVILLLAGIALAAETTTTFKVTGMYCSACETKIQHALQKTDGVRSAAVSLDKGSAVVTYDNAKVKPDQIVKVIEKEGYKAEPQQKAK